jgi:hypothetical protein
MLIELSYIEMRRLERKIRAAKGKGCFVTFRTRRRKDGTLAITGVRKVTRIPKGAS